MSVLSKLTYIRPARYLTYTTPKKGKGSDMAGGKYTVSEAAPQLDPTTGLDTATIKVGEGITQDAVKVIADAVIEEHHQDESVITDHPVQIGSVVTDHSYALPSTVTLTYVWGGAPSLASDLAQPIEFLTSLLPTSANDSDSYLKKIYSSLLELKNTPQLLDVYTGKRIYKNMLIETIAVETDKATENILSVRLGLKQIIFAQTRIVKGSIPTTSQALPQQTTPDTDTGGKNLIPTAPATVFEDGVPVFKGAE